MSLRTTTVIASSCGISALILFTVTINLRSTPYIITRSFYEMFSTSFAFPILEFNGTLASALQFFYLIHQNFTSCRKLFTIEGKSCKKEPIAPQEICLEEEFFPRVGNCTVLSFGLDDELKFEDEILMAFDCNTHVFDPLTPFDNSSKEVLAFSDKETYHPIGLPQSHHVDDEGLKLQLRKLKLESTKIYFIKVHTWGQEWKILEVLLDLGLIEVTQQLTFTSHLNFLKNLDVSSWRHKLQVILDIMARLETSGLSRVFYREARNSLSSLLLPGDDIPRPSCGRFLYLRRKE